MTTDKPYGDVEYADPGYQDDNKARYPLDSEAHCRAALSYISMPKNAAKYTDEQLATIKTKIRAALKRYGVEVEASAEPPPDNSTPDPEAPAESGASSSPAPADAHEAFVPSRGDYRKAMDIVRAAAPETTAPAAEDKTQQKGAGPMNLDPAKIREGLGLAPDAPDDEVKAALVAAGLSQAAPAAEHSDQKLAANAAKAGLITIDPAQLQQYQDGMVRAAALAKRLEAQERDTAIDAAVKAGKFPPARVEHYQKLWGADPDGTRQLIASLAPGLVPVTAMGYSNDAELVEDELDREIARLSQPSGRGA